MGFHHHRQEVLDKDPATKGDVRKLREKLERDYVRKIDFETELRSYSRTDPTLKEMHRIATGKVAIAQNEAQKAAMWDKIREMIQDNIWDSLRLIVVPAIVAWFVSTDFDWSSLFDWLPF